MTAPHSACICYQYDITCMCRWYVTVSILVKHGLEHEGNIITESIQSLKSSMWLNIWVLRRAAIFGHASRCLCQGSTQEGWYLKFFLQATIKDADKSLFRKICSTHRGNGNASISLLKVSLVWGQRSMLLLSCMVYLMKWCKAFAWDSDKREEMNEMGGSFRKGWGWCWIITGSWYANYTRIV